MTDFLVLTLSLLPGFIWFFFYLQEDCHPEPRWLLVFTFFCGAASALVAYAAQRMFSAAFEPLGISALSITALLILASVEELAKFGAAYFAVHNRVEFDEPIDAMIYTVIAALGFATVENLGAVYGNIEGLNPAGMVNAAFQTVSLRFLGATLLHTLTSALIGYHWALDIRRFYDEKLLLVGIVIATLLHAFFNYLVITHGSMSYALLLVVILGFFVLGDFEEFREKRV